MKRILPVFLLILIVPQIAMAAWWNPFSWNIFHRVDTKTQVLENRINELENRLGSTSTSTATTTSIKSTPQVNKKTQIIDSTPVVKTKAQENQERIDAIKKQQAIDRANEEARDAQLKIESQKAFIQEQADIKIQEEKDAKQFLCNDAKTRYKKYTDEDFALQASRQAEIDLQSNRGDIASFAVAGIISNINSNYEKKFAPVRIEESRAEIDVRLNCLY